ncbi:MAG: hypothetical protein ACYC2U_07230 [Candidatus Amoebophilus sp.]
MPQPGCPFVDRWPDGKLLANCRDYPRWPCLTCRAHMLQPPRGHHRVHATHTALHRGTASGARPPNCGVEG